MRIFATFIVISCGCLPILDTTNVTKKFDNPKDAFTVPKSEESSWISYKNHTSTVICRLTVYKLKGLEHYNVADETRNVSFDGNLCTHVVYNGLQINASSGDILKDNSYFTKIDLMKAFNKVIQTKFPHLKILITIELEKRQEIDVELYWQKFLVEIVSKKDKTLISSLIGIVKELNVSGVFFSRNINFNYPDSGKVLLGFAKILKNEFEKNGLLLAVEIPGYSIGELDRLYSRVTQISRIFDFVVVLGWGYDNFYHEKEGHIAPLYVKTDKNKLSSIRKTFLHLIFKMGVRPNKLVLAILLLGAPRSVAIKTENSSTNTKTGALKGRITGNNYWTYFEICHTALAENGTWNVFWDENAKVPYMENGRMLISFESPQSVFEKTIFSTKLGLLGIMSRPTEADDSDGTCTETKHPQLKVINIAFAVSKRLRGSQLCKEFKSYSQNEDDYWQTDLVTVKPYNQSVSEKVKITCIVEGPSVKNISWIKVNENGEKFLIESGQNQITIHPPVFNHNQCLPYNTTNSTLEIKGMEKKFSGKYICNVENGTASETSYLYCDYNCSEKEFLSSSWWWVLLLIGVAAVGATVSICLWILRRKNVGLSATEIHLFNNGDNGIRNNRNHSQEHYVNPDRLKYDYDSFEISDDMFEIDWKNVLGSGTFGIVYKGLFKNNLVAVKTTNPGCGKGCLKSFLQEVKILIHIGQHRNIVSFLGAKTKLLSEGVLYIFVEFAPLGSLEKFLQKSRKTFIPSAINCEVNREVNSYRMYNYCISTSDLAKWSYQIMNAMQHLRRKKVIHGDVATRNVLVFDVNIVKLTDFGLSRKRYNYSNYIKKTKDPLPWRWLAIESLRDTTFSFQSDVWSFGVTLWEIFSLAETPYPGMNSCLDFIKQLETGLRMDIPKYATQPIYNLMRKCWREEPEQRPKIDDIEQDFLVILKADDSSWNSTKKDYFLEREFS